MGDLRDITAEAGPPASYNQRIYDQQALFDAQSLVEPDPHPVTIATEEGPSRWCTLCRQYKQLASFCVNRATRDGIDRHCGDCKLVQQRRHRGVRDQQIGLRPPTGQRCEICGEDGGKRGLFFDHDHATGLFRGWLCHGCNAAIGHLAEDPARFVAAIAYLARSSRSEVA